MKKLLKYLSITVVLLLLFSQVANAKRQTGFFMGMIRLGVSKYIVKKEREKISRYAIMKDKRILKEREIKRILKSHNARMMSLKGNRRIQEEGADILRGKMSGAVGKNARGLWDGEKGESIYSLPKDKEYIKRTKELLGTKGKYGGVRHYNNHPIFHDRYTESMPIENPKGNNKEDIDAAYDAIGDMIGKSRNYVKELFKKEQRTLHHTPDGRNLISVDKYIHRKTSHSGGASLIRMRNRGEIE